MAQIYGIGNLVLSNINKNSLIRKNWSWLRRSNRILNGNGISYLAIQESNRPDLWYYAHLHTHSIRTIRIHRCLFGLKKADTSIINNQFLSQIASTKLISLTISDSRVDSISEDTFSVVPNIRYLDLNLNYITNVNGSIFGVEMISLWYLDLSANRITTISDDIFSYLPSLTHLSLSSNHIVNLNVNIFRPIWSELKEIQLLGNAIDCKGMCWIYKQNKHPNLFRHSSCIIRTESNVFTTYKVTADTVIKYCERST